MKHACVRLSHLLCVIGLACASIPASATTIQVSPRAVDRTVNGNCSIAEAITAAETNAPVDLCAAGNDANDGGDIVALPANVGFVVPRGLPAIGTKIKVRGVNTGVSRESPDDFPLFKVLDTGSLTLQGVKVRNPSHAGTGSGIRTTGTLYVVDSEISGFRGKSGISGSNATITVKNATIRDNTESGLLSAGGGMHVAGGTTSIVNSTITGNSATGALAQGGGFAQDLGGTTDILTSTISGNSASGLGTLGGGIGGLAGVVNVANSIVSDNQVNGNPLDCAGAFIVPSEANLSSDGSCGFSLSSLGALLGLLGNHGGLVQTLVPGAGSPAIDAATGVCPAFDARGVPRDIGGACDLGAIEGIPVLGALDVVDTGTVPYDQASTKRVRISNKGTNDLHVGDIAIDPSTGDAADFRVKEDNCSGQTVLPGTDCTIVVRFKPTDLFERTARIIYDSDAFDGVGEALLTGIGSGARIRLGADRLGFGQSPVGVDGITKQLPVKNTGNVPMTVTGVDATSPSFLVDWAACSAPIAPGATCNVLVTLKPLATGSVGGTLTIVSDAVLGASSVILAGSGI